jgi:hypothetical protein
MPTRFFLSSSSEQLPVAKAIESNLAAEGFEPTLWSREAHAASEYNLEALIRETRSSDFAVFVFAPDDRVIVRGEEYYSVRDNVLFELGVFMGALGRNRCFLVQDTEKPLRLPSDLEGINTLKYDLQRSDQNLRRSMGPLVTVIRELALAVSKAAQSEFSGNDLRLLRSCKDLSMPSNQAHKAFGSAPLAWDDRLCMRFLRLLEKRLIRTNGPTEIETTRSGNLLLAAQTN